MRATRTPLTLASARALLPNEVLYDDAVVGLQLRGNMNSKSWLLQFRTKSRKERHPKLGTFPTMGIEAARKAAKELLDRVAVGEDPCAEWALDAEAATVTDLCADYMDKWAKVRKSSWKDDERLIKKFITPGLGKFAVKDVTIDHVEAFLIDVKHRHPRFHRDNAKAYAHCKSAPATANRVRALLSKMFNLAITRFKMRPDGVNPVRSALRNTERSRRRYGTPDELSRVAGAMADLKDQFPLQIAAIWTLFFTGGRVNEIARAKRSMLRDDVVDVVIDGQVVTRRQVALVLREHKTAERTGEDRVITLSDFAIEIIDKIAPRKDGYIFGGLPLRWVWKKVCEKAGVEGLQLRDARRTFASAALSDGLSLAQVGELLGHRSVQTTKGYAYLMKEPAIRAANSTAARMAEMMRLPRPSQEPRALTAAPHGDPRPAEPAEMEPTFEDLV